MAPTVNIARLIRQNDQYSNAIKHDHELHVANKTSHWFDKQFKLDANRSAKAVEDSDSKDPRVVELQAASLALLLERKNRLTALLQAEREQFASELASLGYAFDLRP